MEINSKMLEKISKKFGYDFSNGILGYGSNGIVYDIGTNMEGKKNVLKVTYNIFEGIAANKLIPHTFKNVVKVYRVFKAKINDSYPMFIEMEKLRPIKSLDIIPEILEYLRTYDRHKNIIHQTNISSKTDNPEETEELLSMYNEDELKFINYIHYQNYWVDIGLSLFMFLHKFESQRKLFNDLVNGLKELYSIGIYHIDIHQNNIMRRGRDYVLTDITSESMENLESMINPNEKIPLLETKIKYATTQEEKHKGLRGIPLEDWSGMMIFKDVKEGDIYVGEGCLFDIRIAFLDMSGKVISTGIIKKGNGRVIAPKGTQWAVETAEADDYKFPIGSFFRPQTKLNVSMYGIGGMGMGLS
jgi:hypothetical protein